MSFEDRTSYTYNGGPFERVKLAWKNVQSRISDIADVIDAEARESYFARRIKLIPEKRLSAFYRKRHEHKHRRSRKSK